jgi:hypothetical protein
LWDGKTTFETYIGIQIWEPMLSDMANTFMAVTTPKEAFLVGIFHFKKVVSEGS